MNQRKGYVRLLSIRGVPVFVHWSFPVGGVLIAVFWRVEPKNWLYYCIAYTLLVAIHEVGHVLAAVYLRLKVFAVEISGAGGLCRFERPPRVRQSVLVYSAGLLAQVGVFLMTIGYLAIFGNPANAFGRAIIMTFTLVNCWMFVVNLIPRRSSRTGLATDGSVLWRLFLHVHRGQPHPSPPLKVTPAAYAPVFPVNTSLLDKPGFRPLGFEHGIEILNDTTTPMDFVVSCLVTHVGLTKAKAIETMLEIHNTGGVLFKLPTAEGASRIAAAISKDARAAGHHLTCRYVSSARA